MKSGFVRPVGGWPPAPDPDVVMTRNHLFDPLGLPMHPESSSGILSSDSEELPES